MRALAATPALDDLKQWRTFPGYAVHAIALRGNAIGGERFVRMVSGRDGWVYLRTDRHLYRITDLAGGYAAVASEPCPGEGVDARTWVPSAVCLQPGLIEEVGAAGVTRVPVPLPTGFDPGPQDDRLTAALPRADGGWWFFYGQVPALGTSSPTGALEVRRLDRVAPVHAMVARGGTLYLADERCNVAEVASFVVLHVTRLGCNLGYPFAARLVAARGEVYAVAAPLRLVTRVSGVLPMRWAFSFAPLDVDVDGHGTLFVLGFDALLGRNVLARVFRDGRTVVDPIPTADATALLLDAEDRVWLVFPAIHALAVLIPQR